MNNDEVLSEIEKVLKSGKLSSTVGTVVKKFEDDFSNYVGSNHAIAVNSGTAALHTSLLAIGIGPGDEVIVPAWTFLSTVSAVVMCGAKPVFADINVRDFGLSNASILNSVTSKTKAVIIVHLAGIPTDFLKIKQTLYDNSIYVIEDACQALGAELNNKKVGTIGDIGVYSFYPSKIMTTGEGGMIVTKHEHIANNCRRIRDHGRVTHFNSIKLGFNYRMTEIQGAIGRVELKEVDKRALINTNKCSEAMIKHGFKDIRFVKVSKNVTKIAPTYIQTWCSKDHKDINREVYIPIYKLYPFKQNVILSNTEYAAKCGGWISI